MYKLYNDLKRKIVENQDLYRIEQRRLSIFFNKKSSYFLFKRIFISQVSL